MPSDTATRRVSRRAVLGAAGASFALGGAGAATGTPASSSGPRATFMTYNLYLGAMLSKLFAVDSVADLRRTVGGLFERARANDPAARMEAIAGEIAAVGPDLVGVQEAALVRTSSSSDGVLGAPTNAEDVYADYLALLRSALADRGVPYDVAAKLVTVDVELPGVVDGATVDVRVTDRVAILERRDGDVETTDPVSRHYADGLPVSVLPDIVPRGYCAVRATVDGADLTFVSTHLESGSRHVRRAQARELADRYGDVDGPVVVVGDMNSGPGGATTDAYDALRESFRDASRAGSPGPTGMTCCNPADLRSESPAFDRRIDHVFVRGPVRATDSRRVGLRKTPGGDGSDRLWPSDHAGVAVTARLGARPAATAARTEAEGSPVAGASVPGFGVTAALVALGAAAVGALSASD